MARTSRKGCQLIGQRKEPKWGELVVDNGGSAHIPMEGRGGERPPRPGTNETGKRSHKTGSLTPTRIGR